MEATNQLNLLIDEWMEFISINVAKWVIAGAMFSSIHSFDLVYLKATFIPICFGSEAEREKQIEEWVALYIYFQSNEI